MKTLLFLLFFTFCFHSVADEISGKENWFDLGLKAYQTKNWDAARENFEKALQFQPNEAAIMYNLGLAYFQLNKKGYAVGYWRKALAIAPFFTGPGEALDKIQEKYHLSRLEKSPWAISTHDFLTRFGWNLWLALLAILISTAGWLWLSYLQQRKTALANESETPTPSWTLLVLSVFFLLIGTASIAKWIDDQKIRGTVVNASAELKSAPTDDGVTLSALAEAAEVQIVSAHEDWLQINTGEAGGWVKKSDVLPASKDL